MDLSVSSSSWGLGRAAVCDCGTPWTFLLPFFVHPVFNMTAVLGIPRLCFFKKKIEKVQNRAARFGSHYANRIFMYFCIKGEVSRL